MTSSILPLSRPQLANTLNSGAPSGLLHSQAKIGILCDSVIQDSDFNLTLTEARLKASKLIMDLGYVPVIDDIHAKTQPYFNRWQGTPFERAEHFIRLIEDYQVDAVFPLFGKSGGSSVIDEMIKMNYQPTRKIVFIGGFSQHSDWGLFSLSHHGKAFFSCVISATQCAYHDILPQSNIKKLANILATGNSIEFLDLLGINPPSNQLTRDISGTFIGGNLGVLLMNLHKEWFPSLEDAIVFCEDYDRHVHDYHRHFEYFALEVYRRGARAILVGDHLPITKRSYFSLNKDQQKKIMDDEKSEIMHSLTEVACRIPIPVFYKKGAIGHGLQNTPVQIGSQATISVQGTNHFKLTNQVGVFND